MSRYAAAHVNPQGPGDARPTALQIINDEGMEGKLDGKVIVITGTSSGIGIETARALYTTGAKLFLTARDVTKARAALADIANQSPNRVEFIYLDQSSLESIRAGARDILAKTDKVNILINNAGVMALQNLELTKNGYEMQFGVNHLSHFLLFQLLRPALLAAVTPESHSRVVTISSDAHLISGINSTDNYSYEQGDYDPWRAYGQSKTANIYLANEIERQFGAQGLHATSVHPGGILTELPRHLSEEQIGALVNSKEDMKKLKSPQQGAATTVWAAIGRQWEGHGGRYLVDCAEGQLTKSEKLHWNSGYAAHAFDEELEGRLWRDSLRLVGLL